MHPNVYFSPIKEPRFFCTDFQDYSYSGASAQKDYLALFEAASDAHLAIGEGTARYLYSNEAVPRILDFNPNARLIAMVRNPIAMVQSVHARGVYEAIENVMDFETAWRLQDSRRAGRHIPALCRDPQMLLYGDRCLLGAQLEKAYNVVPKEQLLVIVFDDFRRNPKRVYERVLAFLGVPSDGRAAFPVINANQGYRSPRLQRLMLLLGSVKRAMGIQRGLGIHRRLFGFNIKSKARPTLHSELRAELCDYFSPDVEKLSSLLDRDLSHWISQQA
jgi:hypothetical protein